MFKDVQTQIYFYFQILLAVKPCGALCNELGALADLLKLRGIKILKSRTKMWRRNSMIHMNLTSIREFLNWFQLLWFEHKHSNSMQSFVPYIWYPSCYSADWSQPLKLLLHFFSGLNFILNVVKPSEYNAHFCACLLSILWLEDPIFGPLFFMLFALYNFSRLMQPNLLQIMQS